MSNWGSGLPKPVVETLGRPLPDRGGLTLGLAIGGVVCTGCAPLGLGLSIVALRMAVRDQRLIASGQTNQDGRSLTIAGRSIVGVRLGACSVLMLLAYAVFAIFVATRG